MGWMRWLVLNWVGSFLEFAWGQVAEDRRVAGGKSRRFFALFISSSYRLFSNGWKRAGVGRPEWQKIQEFRKRQQRDTTALSGADLRAGE